MNTFVTLITNCLQTTKTNEKIELLKTYFQQEEEHNLVYAFHFLMGKNLGRFCSSKDMCQWCANWLNLPQWLVDETVDIVGDNSESIASIFNTSQSTNKLSIADICVEIKKRKSDHVTEKKDWIISQWSTMSSDQIYCFNKLLTSSINS